MLVAKPAWAGKGLRDVGIGQLRNNLRRESETTNGIPARMTVQSGYMAGTCSCATTVTITPLVSGLQWSEPGHVASHQQQSTAHDFRQGDERTNCPMVCLLQMSCGRSGVPIEFILGKKG